jgi:hypothetical protein
MNRQETQMHKKSHLMIMILTLLLTACGNARNTAGPASGNQNATSSGELSVPMQIAIGTLKLDKTASDVTSDQAAKLLPLWETMQLLETSDTAAKQEIDALDTQIQETMTAQQMQAITGMNLTRQDMFAILQAQGGGTGFGQGSGQGFGQQSTNRQGGNSTGNRNRNFGGGGGFVPGAGGPPDGGGFGGGQGFGGQGSGGQGQNRSASQIATAQARQVNAANRIPAPLINALIEYLKKKAGS